MSDTRRRFGPVERRTLAEEIRQQIQDQILEGVLATGTRLPSERQLCEEFNVARTSVREAIQGLISLGLVVRRGNRAFVMEELPSLGGDTLDQYAGRVRELFEVRRVIELPMIELAADRATAEEREQIVALAEQFTDEMPLEEFRRLDRGFHWALARASHNSLLAEVYGKVLDALFESEEWTRLLYERVDPKTVRGIIVSSAAEHRHISDAVKDADPLAALSSMAAHLDTVESRLVAQLV